MKSKSLHKLDWIKLRQNKLAFFSFCYILLAIFVAIFVVPISPDSTPNANEMHVELANSKPLTKVVFLEIPRDSQQEILNNVYKRDIQFHSQDQIEDIIFDYLQENKP